MTRYEEVKGVAVVCIDALPFNPTSELLGVYNKLDGHILLTGADKNYRLKILVEAR